MMVEVSVRQSLLRRYFTSLAKKIGILPKSRKWHIGQFSHADIYDFNYNQNLNICPLFQRSG